MNAISVINQILLRIKSKSPKLFVIIQWFAVIMGLACWGLNGAIAANFIHLAAGQTWNNYLNTLGGIFVGIFITGLIPTADPKLISPELKEAIIKEAKDKEPLTGT